MSITFWFEWLKWLEILSPIKCYSRYIDNREI